MNQCVTWIESSSAVAVDDLAGLLAEHQQVALLRLAGQRRQVRQGEHIGERAQSLAVAGFRGCRYSSGLGVVQRLVWNLLYWSANRPNWFCYGVVPRDAWWWLYLVLVAWRCLVFIMGTLLLPVYARLS